MSKTIIIGPDNIEFGWMLQFIGRARKKAEQYDRVVVYCEEPNEYLYQDFATDFISFDYKKGWRDRWFFGGKRLSLPKLIIESFPGAKLFTPTRKHCLGGEGKFVKYGHPDDGARADVLIHARNIKRGDWIDRACGGDHNWGKENFEQLASRLKGKTVASIGTQKDAHHIPGTKDFRDAPIMSLCGAMSKASVIVGESSGPMHLASLCGLPHVVITHGRPEKSINGHTNKWRYMTGWNPLKTECCVVEHPRWNPTVDDVMLKVLRYV